MGEVAVIDGVPQVRTPGPLCHRTKFDEGRRKIILRGREKGLPVTRCAALAKVSKHTLYSWLERGRACDENGEPLEPEFAEFLVEYEFAQAKWVDDTLAQIDEHGKRDWKALAWRLERAIPDEFGRKERVDISSEEPIKVQLSW